METNKERTLRLVMLAILLALTVVLQLWGSSIRIGPTGFSLVLIPIVLGGILVGPVGGTVLGLTFGLIVLLTDPLAATLINLNPVMTVLLCLGKGGFAGLAAGWIYRLLRGKNELAAVFAAAAAAPIVNTGLFILGMLTVFPNIMSALAVAEGQSVFKYIMTSFILLNFCVEFPVNLVVSPALHRVVTVVTKRLDR